MACRLSVLGRLVFLQFFVLKYGVVVVCGGHPSYKFSDLLVFVAQSSEKLNYNDMQEVLVKLRFENCSTTDRKKECNRVNRKRIGFLVPPEHLTCNLYSFILNRAY